MAGCSCHDGCFFFFLPFLLFFFLHPLFVKRSEAANITKSNSSSSSFPQIIVQVGTPRTATTTQYAVLLAIAELRNPGHVTSGYFAPPYIPAPRLQAVRNGFTLVAKLHHCGPLNNLNSDRYSTLKFSTDTSPHKWCRDRRTPAVIQDPNQYFHRGFPYLVELIENEYKPLFGLNDTEMALVVEFMEKFEPVRRCCGNQMSASFASYLRTVGLKEGSHFFDYMVPNTTGSSLPHFCADKNLTRLAFEYSETTLVKNFSGPLRADYHYSCMEGLFMFRAGLPSHQRGGKPVKGALTSILRMKQFEREMKTKGFKWFDDEEVFQLLKQRLHNMIKS